MRDVLRCSGFSCTKIHLGWEELKYEYISPEKGIHIGRTFNTSTQILSLQQATGDDAVR